MVADCAITELAWPGTVRFFCQDDSRFDLKTLTGRRLTACGVKPVGKVRWTFQATDLYGVVEPATGEPFFYEFTHCLRTAANAFSNGWLSNTPIVLWSFSSTKPGGTKRNV
ncbi:MAG: hypothetical protein AAGG53_14700 [Cyanobacteria bacterium P01_H01_bin.152]